mmetsp:Transcript_19556/g.27292  ORF Transcript_19556/g.27292 Transcript_19556/m.27292 type:complete len:81 (+) Transcript_19556:749-991(+)
MLCIRTLAQMQSKLTNRGALSQDLESRNEMSYHLRASHQRQSTIPVSTQILGKKQRPQQDGENKRCLDFGSEASFTRVID